MDLALVIKYRLEELGLEQKDLAAAAHVTESYISQLLARKKVPPAAARTEIYARMSQFLKLPEGELSTLADVQRREKLKKQVEEPLQALHGEYRELILGKCVPSRRREVRAIFEKEPFGELEWLITQKVLDTARTVAQEQLQDEAALRLMAELSGRTPEQIRAAHLDFLDAGLFDASFSSCVWFLELLIESWDIDLKTFQIDVVLNRKLVARVLKRFEFVETDPAPPLPNEPGLAEFLANPSLSGDVTRDELAFLKTLNFDGRRPTPIYYYRELQNLRDPLHFRGSSNFRSLAQKKGLD